VQRAINKLWLLRGGMKMIFSYSQRKFMPLCKFPRRYHSWKKGVKIFKESGICGVCGYDVYDDLHRAIPQEEV